MITSISSPVNGAVYYVDDLLTDQVVVGVRSSEQKKEVLSVDRINRSTLYYTSDVDGLIKKTLDNALAAHSVYWNSRLWC